MVSVDDVTIRGARDADATGLIRLIGAVFSEYPGVLLDVDGEMPELRRIASVFAELGGEFWVAETGGQVVASVGWVPSEGGPGVELRKLYVAKPLRGRGLGSRLCQRVEDAGAARGAGFVELWSDTRFETAHRLYAGRAYRRGAETRALADISSTIEFYFRKELGGDGAA